MNLRIVLSVAQIAQTFENTFLVEIAWRVVWEVVCQTFSTVLLRTCLGDINVPNIENSGEPLLELCYSASGCIGHYPRLLREIEDIVVQPSLDSASNLTTELFIPSMVFRARLIAK